MFEKFKSKLAKKIKNKKLFYAGFLTWLLGFVFMIIAIICFVYHASSAGIVLVCLSMIFIPGCLILSKGVYSKAEIQDNERIEMIADAKLIRVVQEESQNNDYLKWDRYFSIQVNNVSSLMNNSDCNNAVEKLVDKNPQFRFNSLIMYCLPFSYNEKIDWVELAYDDEIIRKHIKNRINELKSQNKSNSIEYKICKQYSNIICNVGIEENGKKKIVSKLDFFDFDDYYLGNAENGIQEVETLYYGLLANSIISDIPITDFYMYIQLKISDINHIFGVKFCNKYELNFKEVVNNILKLLSSIDLNINLLSIDADWEIEEKFENKFVLYLMHHPNNYLFNLLKIISNEKIAVKQEFLSICFFKIFSCDFEVCISLARIAIEAVNEINNAKKSLEKLLDISDNDVTNQSNSQKVAKQNTEIDECNEKCINDNETISNRKSLATDELSFDELNKVFAIIDNLQDRGKEDLRMEIFELYEQYSYATDKMVVCNAKFKLREIIQNLDDSTSLKQLEIKRVIEVIHKVLNKYK